jgi:hypothetical protein
MFCHSLEGGCDGFADTETAPRCQSGVALFESSVVCHRENEGLAKSGFPASPAHHVLNVQIRIPAAAHVSLIRLSP